MQIPLTCASCKSECNLFFGYGVIRARHPVLNVKLFTARFNVANSPTSDSMPTFVRQIPFAIIVVSIKDVRNDSVGISLLQFCEYLFCDSLGTSIPKRI